VSPHPKPKVPRTPPNRLEFEPHDIVDGPGMLWRLHRTTGEHVLAWNTLRRYGPLPSMRWEPHGGPQPGPHEEGVLYAASDIATSLAEIYQTTRLIDTRGGTPALTAWRPIRPLRLLDLTGTWPVRNGASAALPAAPRSSCRSWARATFTTWPDLDGLLVTSTMTGRVNTVLWNAAADSFPPAPEFSRPLDHPVVWSLVQAAAGEINYRLR